MVDAQIATVEFGPDGVVIIFDALAAAMPDRRSVTEATESGPVALDLDTEGYLVQVTLGGQSAPPGPPSMLRSSALGDGFVHLWAGTGERPLLGPQSGAVVVIESAGGPRGVWVSRAYPLRRALETAIATGHSLGYADYLTQPHVRGLFESIAGRWGDPQLRTAMAATPLSEPQRAKTLLTLAEGFGRSAWGFDEETEQFRALQAASFATEMAALALRGDLG